MRISDWSSDVCSSDLDGLARSKKGEIMRLFFAAAVLALPTALHAEPMSLDDALRLAETRAPELQAREAGLDAARPAAIAADRIPDPKLNLNRKSTSLNSSH